MSGPAAHACNADLPTVDGDVGKMINSPGTPSASVFGEKRATPSVGRREKCVRVLDYRTADSPRPELPRRRQERVYQGQSDRDFPVSPRKAKAWDLWGKESGTPSLPSSVHRKACRLARLIRQVWRGQSKMAPTVVRGGGVVGRLSNPFSFLPPILPLSVQSPNPF